MADGSVVEKVLDKVSGVLEKMTDMRMFLLGLTLIVYVDIWLIQANVNPGMLTFETGIAHLKTVSIETIVACFLAYSLLMALVFPALRYLIGALWMLISPGSHFHENRGAEAKQFSNWALGLLLLSVYSASQGFLVPAFQYKGMIHHTWHYLFLDGFTVMIFRVTIGLFCFFCVSSALEKDL